MTLAELRDAINAHIEKHPDAATWPAMAVAYGTPLKVTWAEACPCGCGALTINAIFPNAH